MKWRSIATTIRCENLQEGNLRYTGFAEGNSLTVTLASKGGPGYQRSFIIAAPCCPILSGRPDTKYIKMRRQCTDSRSQKLLGRVLDRKGHVITDCV